MNAMYPDPQQASGAVLIPTGVVISQEAIWNEVRSTHDAVVRLARDVEAIGDHETRLRHLERRVWTAAGIAAAFASVASLIGGVVISHLIGGA